ncbi:hypothetical protein CLOSPO_03069 [Clostridium sporogenes ATCC 15579]|nr:hypothetical protein CLOSPO_03069 [Clostridium sporogenes ATCC 15579]
MYLILIETPHVFAQYVHIVSNLHLIHIFIFSTFLFIFLPVFEKKLNFFIFIFIIQKLDKNN